MKKRMRLVECSGELPPGASAGRDRVPLTRALLADENDAFEGSGGVSAANHGAGFRPAFRDRATGRVYLSRFSDGRAAPLHLLDGLPPSLVAARGVDGRVKAATDGVEAGFTLRGAFYTRAEAACELAGRTDPRPCERVH